MSEDRWNRGWLGRGRARDCLPDRERPWPVPIVPMVLCRLSVEGGAGMPEVRLTPWRVYRESRVNIVHDRVGWGEVSIEETRREEVTGGSRTSLGRRTLQRPALLSCDMTAKASSICASRVPS